MVGPVRTDRVTDQQVERGILDTSPTRQRGTEVLAGAFLSCAGCRNGIGATPRQRTWGPRKVSTASSQSDCQNRCVPEDIRVARWHALPSSLTQLQGVKGEATKISACHRPQQSWHALPGTQVSNRNS